MSRQTFQSLFYFWCLVQQIIPHQAYKHVEVSMQASRIIILIQSIKHTHRTGWSPFCCRPMSSSWVLQSTSFIIVFVLCKAEYPTSGMGTEERHSPKILVGSTGGFKSSGILLMSVDIIRKNDRIDGTLGGILELKSLAVHQIQRLSSQLCGCLLLLDCVFGFLLGQCDCAAALQSFLCEDSNRN